MLTLLWRVLFIFLEWCSFWISCKSLVLFNRSLRLYSSIYCAMPLNLLTRIDKLNVGVNLAFIPLDILAQLPRRRCRIRPQRFVMVFPFLRNWISRLMRFPLLVEAYRTTFLESSQARFSFLQMSDFLYYKVWWQSCFFHCNLVFMSNFSFCKVWCLIYCNWVFKSEFSYYRVWWWVFSLLQLMLFGLQSVIFLLVHFF